MYKAAGKKYRDKAKFTDAVLFSLISDGDQAAYAEIYDRYWEKLFLTACSRLGSEELAQDVVQDIFLKLYINRYELQAVQHPSRYLFTALKYNVYTAYRSQVIHHRYVDRFMGTQIQSFHNPVEEQVEERELGSAVQAITDQLPDRCRQVFVYSRDESLSQKEIADKLGISVSTVKKHLTKALRTMRSGLRHFLQLLLYLHLL